MNSVAMGMTTSESSRWPAPQQILGPAPGVCGGGTQRSCHGVSGERIVTRSALQGPATQDAGMANV